MEKMVRDNPRFSLCGLNCCLCPRFNADGPSRCPGCGGPGFSEKHPTCAVATCNRKHDNVEYCFQCGSYPCKKYETESACDSFISYRSVKRNFADAARGIAEYGERLSRRYELLQWLLSNCNDGRSKGLYCLVSNDMPLEDLEKIAETASALDAEADVREKAKFVRAEVAKVGDRLGISFALRKKQKESQ